MIDYEKELEESKNIDSDLDFYFLRSGREDARVCVSLNNQRIWPSYDEGEWYGLMADCPYFITSEI